MAQPLDTSPSDSPLAIGRVVLTVHDLDRVATFYEDVVGLDRFGDDGSVATLGACGEILVELRRDPTARQSSPREAGLFHIAILLPDRAALAGWLADAVARRLPLLGASDHGVSEALYLVDPEGNGVELYADHPPSQWRWSGGQVAMPSDPLDLRRMLARADRQARHGLPPGTRIGHVHLKVGSIAPAEHFYAGILGLGITARYPGGTFYATGGYHHQIATNIWNSRGAGRRGFPATGLAEVEIRATPAMIAAIRERAPDATPDGDGLHLDDPWGTRLRIVPLTNDNPPPMMAAAKRN